MIDASEQSNPAALAQPGPSSNDSIMVDASTLEVMSPNTMIATSDAPEVDSVSSPTNTLPRGTELSEATPEPTTPKGNAAEEHDDDVPMIDISPGKESKDFDSHMSKPGRILPVFDPGTSPPKSTPKSMP